MRLPPNGKWISSGRSDRQGSLWSSFGIDFISNPGAMRVSPRTIITTDGITDLGVPVAFQTFTDQSSGTAYSWCVAGGYVFRTGVSGGYQNAFAKDSSTGTPNNTCSSDTSDIAYYGKDWMVVTSTDDVYRYNASTGQWNDGSNVLGGGVHMICVYGTLFYVTASAGTKIYSFAPANYNSITTTGGNSLNLANKSWNVTSITTIKPTLSRIWIGTLNQSENGCYMFAWDGATANDPNEAYLIPDASGILACEIKNDVPWIIDNNARLLVFNGGSFVEPHTIGLAYGRLPVKNAKFLKNSLSAVNDRWIHPNGMKLVDGRFNILINNEYNDNGATIEENIASGLWEYDTQIGWYHKQPLSLYTNSITDYGQNRVSRVGAIYANKHSTTNSSANGTMLIGAQLYTDASTTKNVILIDDSNDTVQKYGYYVTSWIRSSQIKDITNQIHTTYRKFLNAGDKIIIKYRHYKDVPTEITLTWTSTSTFTTTTDVSAMVGYEVEILQGKGGGKTAHISSVTGSGTYTVTLDDTFTGASSGTAKARVQSWKKSGEITSTTDQNTPLPLGGNTEPMVQLKVCMQFTGQDEIYDHDLIAKPMQLAQ